MRTGSGPSSFRLPDPPPLHGARSGSASEHPSPQPPHGLRSPGADALLPAGRSGQGAGAAHVAAHTARLLLARLPDADAPTQRRVYRIVEELSPSAITAIAPLFDPALGPIVTEHPTASSGLTATDRPTSTDRSDGNVDPADAVVATLVRAGELQAALSIGAVLLTPPVAETSSEQAGWAPDEVARWLVVAQRELDEQALQHAIERHQTLAALLAQRLGDGHPASHQARLGVSRLRSLAARYRAMTRR